MFVFSEFSFEIMIHIGTNNFMQK